MSWLRPAIFYPWSLPAQPSPLSPSPPHRDAFSHPHHPSSKRIGYLRTKCLRISTPSPLSTSKAESSSDPGRISRTSFSVRPSFPARARSRSTERVELNQGAQFQPSMEGNSTDLAPPYLCFPSTHRPRSPRLRLRDSFHNRPLSLITSSTSPRAYLPASSFWTSGAVLPSLFALMGWTGLRHVATGLACRSLDLPRGLEETSSFSQVKSATIGLRFFRFYPPGTNRRTRSQTRRRSSRRSRGWGSSFRRRGEDKFESGTHGWVGGQDARFFKRSDEADLRGGQERVPLGALGLVLVARLYRFRLGTAIQLISLVQIYLLSFKG